MRDIAKAQAEIESADKKFKSEFENWCAEYQPIYFRNILGSSGTDDIWNDLEILGVGIEHIWLAHPSNGECVTLDGCISLPPIFGGSNWEPCYLVITAHPRVEANFKGPVISFDWDYAVDTDSWEDDDFDDLDELYELTDETGIDLENIPEEWNAVVAQFGKNLKDPAMRFCTECGVKNSVGAKFCGACGKLINEEKELGGKYR